MHHSYFSIWLINWGWRVHQRLLQIRSHGFNRPWLQGRFHIIQNLFPLSKLLHFKLPFSTFSFSLYNTKGKTPLSQKSGTGETCFIFILCTLMDKKYSNFSLSLLRFFSQKVQKKLIFHVNLLFVSDMIILMSRQGLKKKGILITNTKSLL